MMNKSQGLSTSSAILLGAAMISASVLVSGGVIKLKKNNDVVNPPSQPQAAQQAQPVAKTADQIVVKLKEYAGKLGLDQAKFTACLDGGSKASLVKADYDEGTKLGVNGTPSFFINGRPLFIGAAPYEQFKTVLDEEFLGTNTTTERKTVSIGNLPVKGDLNAKVTLVEFSDYQCPFCGRFYSQAEKSIIEDYVNTGKVRIYYRDYPLSQIHPGAQKGAEAARCAGDQNKYWEYHNLVFENQPDIF